MIAKLIRLIYVYIYIYIYTAQSTTKISTCTVLKSISTEISMHQCIYFTVFPAISVTVELTPIYMNMGVG